MFGTAFSNRVLYLLAIGLALIVEDAASGLQKKNASSKEFDKLTLRIESEYIYGSHRLTVDGATGNFRLETDEIDGTFKGKLSGQQFELMNKVVREADYLREGNNDDEIPWVENEHYTFTLERDAQKSVLGRSDKELTPKVKRVVDFFEKLISQEEHHRDLSLDRMYWPETLLFINIDLDEALKRRALNEFSILPLSFERLKPRLQVLATSDDPRLVSRASRALRAIRDLPKDYMGEPVGKAKRLPQGDALTEFHALNITFHSPIKDEVRISADGWCRINDPFVKISEGEMLRLDELCRATHYFLDEKAKFEKVDGNDCEMTLEMVARHKRIHLRGPNQTKAYSALMKYCLELVKKYKKKTTEYIQWQDLDEDELPGVLEKDRPVLIRLWSFTRSDVYQNFEAAFNSPSILKALKEFNVVCLDGKMRSKKTGVDDPFAEPEPALVEFQRKYYEGPGLALYDPKTKKIKPITFGRSVKVKEILLNALRELEQ